MFTTICHKYFRFRNLNEYGKNFYLFKFDKIHRICLKITKDNVTQMNALSMFKGSRYTCNRDKKLSASSVKWGLLYLFFLNLSQAYDYALMQEQQTITIFAKGINIKNINWNLLKYIILDFLSFTFFLQSFLSFFYLISFIFIYFFLLFIYFLFLLFGFYCPSQNTSQ